MESLCKKLANPALHGTEFAELPERKYIYYETARKHYQMIQDKSAEAI